MVIMSQKNLHTTPQGVVTGKTQNMNIQTSRPANTSSQNAVNNQRQNYAQPAQTQQPVLQPTKGIATFYVGVVDGSFTSIQEFQSTGFCFVQQSYEDLYILNAKEFAHLKSCGRLLKLKNVQLFSGGNYLTLASYVLEQQENFLGYHATVLGTQGKFAEAQALYQSVTNNKNSLEQRLSSLRQVALTKPVQFSKDVDAVVHSAEVNYLHNNLQNILNEEQFANVVYFANLDAIEKHPDFIVTARNRYLHRQIEELQRNYENEQNKVKELLAKNQELNNNFNKLKDEKSDWEDNYKGLLKEFYERLDKATINEKRRLESVVTQLRKDFQEEVNQIINEIKTTVAQTYTFPRPTEQQVQEFMANNSTPTNSPVPATKGTVEIGDGDVVTANHLLSNSQIDSSFQAPNVKETVATGLEDVVTISRMKNNSTSTSYQVPAVQETAESNFESNPTTQQDFK